MKNKWSLILTVILAVTMVVILSIAAATAEKPTVVLSRWAGPHADDQKTVLAEYPDAIVKVDDVDYSNLKVKQIQSLSTSADYDLVWASEIWLAEYVSKGWFLPLNDLISKYKVDLSIFSKAMVDMNTTDGKLYAIPTFAQTLILTYNKEWFEKEGQKVPTTVDELLAVAKYFKEKGTGIAIPAMQGQAAADLYGQILYSAGGDYFGSDGKVNLLSGEALYAAEVWDKLCEYSITGSLTWHHDQVSAAVREEVAPIGITITGLSGLDSDPKMSKIVDKVGYAPIPGKKSVVGVVSYWSWGVAKNSKNPEAAFKLAVWLVSPEVEKKQALMNGQIGAISSLAQDSEVVAKMPFLPATSETLANAKTQPTSVSAGKIFEPLIAALSEIASTNKAPKDVLAKLQNDLKDVTSK
jgi:ABC-type glycerol-3-phosphate transport system substrate-binding protein